MENGLPLVDFFGELPKLYFACLRRRMNGEEHAHPRQGPILCLLLSRDGMSQADLVRKLDVSAATVAVSIARLVRLGYVTRERNMRNQRANTLYLTEKGRAEADRMRQAMDALCGVALAGMSPEERQTLAQLVRRMEENLRQSYENAERE